jgi:hypothetical protein
MRPPNSWTPEQSRLAASKAGILLRLGFGDRHPVKLLVVSPIDYTHAPGAKRFDDAKMFEPPADHGRSSQLSLTV